MRTAGQCFCVGLSGETPTPEERRFIATMAPGGFILARRNLASIDAARALVDEVSALTREAGGIPPFFAADEEGGFVQQLDRFATPAPSPLAVARTGRPEVAARLARAMGERLRALGIAVAFAPVVDVNDHPGNPVIGVRSSGGRPAEVSRFAREWFTGFREAGVFATAKHFPGHGSTSLDSHRDLPIVPHDRSRLDAVELPPFREAIAAGAPLVMSAHVAYPRVDPAAEMPATFVPYFTRRVLREELGFTGVLASDDLGMRAVSDHFAPREVARLGREAGVDLLLYALDPDLAMMTWEAMVDGAASGRFDRGDLEASIARVLAMKRAWLGEEAVATEPAAWRDRGRAFEAADGDVDDIAREVAPLAVWSRTYGGASSPWAPRAGERLAVLVVAGSAGGSRFDETVVGPHLARHRGFMDVAEIGPAGSAPAGSGAVDRGILRDLFGRTRAADRVLIAILARGECPAWLGELIVELGREVRPVAVLSVLAPLELPPAPALRLQVASFGWSPFSLDAAFDRLWNG